MAFEELLSRIQKRLEAMGLSERKACLKASLHIDAVRNIRRGSAPRATTLVKLAKVLDCPPSYFLEVAESLEEDVQALESDQVTPPGYVWVKTLEIRPGMGGGGNGDEDPIGPPSLLPEHLIVRELRGTPEDFILMEVEGQSMAPVLESGDQLLIDTRKKNVQQPGIFVVHDGLGWVAKWVEHVAGTVDPPEVRIFSENERFKEYHRTLDEARLIGRVVWFARRM